jgi:hypothetical protein
MIAIRYVAGVPVAAIVMFAAFSAAYAADPPATAPVTPSAPADSKSTSAPGEAHMMMDHSPADIKSMNKMKDKKIPIHHAGDPPLKSPDADKPVDHMMMDHSPADIKSMNKMKDKKIPIHRSGKAEPTSDSNSPKP